MSIKEIFTTLWFLSAALANQKVKPPFYKYSDLKSATRDFHKDNKLGHGGFGDVYMVRSQLLSTGRTFLSLLAIPC